MTSSFRQKRAVRRQHEPGRKDLAPVIDRGQLQIITAGLVPPGSHGSVSPVTQVHLRGAVMLDTSRSSPGSVAA